MIGIVAAGVGAGFGISALGATLVGAHLRNNVARDIKIHEAEYGPNCNFGDPRYCQLDRQVINADGADANRMRNLSVGLGISAGVIGIGGLVFAILAKDEPAAAAKPKDETPPPAAKVGVRSIDCGPYASLGFSCAGTF